MKSAFVEAFKVFIKTVKSNHLDYCKSVVKKAEESTKKQK